MRRRAFITLLGGAAAAWPLAARAQQPAMPVIGFLGSESPDLWASRVRAFRQGLSETGYVEGRNVAIEFRWAESQNDRLPALVADLVRRRVAVIAAPGGAPTAVAAKAATTTIPIVFQIGGDPVALGLIASLNRPGGNLTGVTSLGIELGPKKLELVHTLVPAANVIGLLVNPTNPDIETQLKVHQAAASSLGLELLVLRANAERDLDAAFATLTRLRVKALVVGTDVFFSSRSELLGDLANRHAMPTVYQSREFAAAGGLLSYGDTLAERSHLVGVYAGRILKGERPADLPVQQSTKIELIINLKTAKALGLTVPLALLTRADEVIE
jgi:putative ABC transport system substrate-binding protein